MHVRFSVYETYPLACTVIIRFFPPPGCHLSVADPYAFVLTDASTPDAFVICTDAPAICWLPDLTKTVVLVHGTNCIERFFTLSSPFVGEMSKDSFA